MARRAKGNSVHLRRHCRTDHLQPLESRRFNLIASEASFAIVIKALRTQLYDSTGGPQQWSYLQLDFSRHKRVLQIYQD